MDGNSVLSSPASYSAGGNGNGHVYTDLGLANRVYVITGAAIGNLGAAYAEELAKHKPKGIVICDINQQGVEELAQKLYNQGVPVLAKKVDVTSYDQCSILISEGAFKFGQIDAVVANAGITDDKPFHLMSRANWDRVADFHSKAFYNSVHPAFVYMKSLLGYDNSIDAMTDTLPLDLRKNIVVITSTSAIDGNGTQENYSFGKLGIVGAMRSLVQEMQRLGVKYDNRLRIVFNAFAPLAYTPMTAKIPAKDPLRIPHSATDVEVIDFTNEQTQDRYNTQFAAKALVTLLGTAAVDNNVTDQIVIAGGGKIRKARIVTDEPTYFDPHGATAEDIAAAILHNNEQMRVSTSWPDRLAETLEARMP